MTVLLLHKFEQKKSGSCYSPDLDSVDQFGSELDDDGLIGSLVLDLSTRNYTRGLWNLKKKEKPVMTRVVNDYYTTQVFSVYPLKDDFLTRLFLLGLRFVILFPFHIST